MARRLSEQLARKEVIDPQLEKPGWYLNPKQKHNNSKIILTRFGRCSPLWGMNCSLPFVSETLARSV